MKKLTSITLILAIALSMVTAYATSFKDIKPNEWFYTDTMQAVEKGFVVGYPDGTFRQGNNITNAEFITVMDKAMGYPVGQASGQWYQAFVDACINAGVIAADEIGNYNAPINREKMVEYTCKALGIPPADSLATLFADTKTVDNKWINAAFNEYLTRGKSYQNKTRVFGYGESMTRAQLATMGMRIYKYRTDPVTFKADMKATVEANEKRQDGLDSGELVYSKGYYVPVKSPTATGLGVGTISAEQESNDKITGFTSPEFDACISLIPHRGTNENAQEQYIELRSILKSKFLDSTIDTVFAYMQTKASFEPALPEKIFYLEGKTFKVDSQARDGLINLYIS